MKACNSNNNITIIINNIITTNNETDNIADNETLAGFVPYVSAAHRWTISILFVLLAVTGLGLNLVSLVSLLRHFRHYSVSCAVVLNLLVADVIVCLVFLVKQVSIMVTFQVAQYRLLCLGHMGTVLGSLSAVQLSLLLVLLDNFLAVVCPFRHRLLVTRRAACVAVAGIWIYSFLIICVFPYIHVFNAWQSTESCVFYAVITKSFRSLLAFQFGAVMTVMVTLYVIILVTAARHHRRMTDQTRHLCLTAQERKRLLDKCSNARCRGLLVLSFFVCWLPVCLLEAIEDSFTSHVTLRIVSSYLTLFVVLNAALNPLVCVWRNRRFKAAVDAFFRSRDQGLEHPETMNMTLL